MLFEKIVVHTSPCTTRFFGDSFPRHPVPVDSTLFFVCVHVVLGCSASKTSPAVALLFLMCFVPWCLPLYECSISGCFSTSSCSSDCSSFCSVMLLMGINFGLHSTCVVVPARHPSEQGRARTLCTPRPSISRVSLSKIHCGMDLRTRRFTAAEK